MSDRINAEPGSGQIIEPIAKRHPSRPHRMLMLVSASLLALGALAVPVDLGLDRGSLLTEAAAAEKVDIEVMTLNQALGADLVSLLDQPPDELNAALLDLLEGLVATNFPARAQRQAKLIAGRLPDLIGLQEVWHVSCQDASPSDDQGCEHPSIAEAFVDHLEVTLDALDALGLDYEVIARVRNRDATTATLDLVPLGGIPFEIEGVLALLTSSDRDVILARADTVIDPVPVGFPVCLESLEGCNYQAVAPVALTTPDGLLELDFRVGFVAVDATVGDKDYRFVNTHLEIHEPAPGNPLSRFFQAAQAAELIATLALTTPPGLSLIVVGDTNSSPEHEPVPGPSPLPEPFDLGIIPPYMQFVDAGYTDIWTLRPGAVPGFTCCQDPDLANKRSKLSERIDMIFSLEPPSKVRQVRVVGDRASDKTPPPGPRLWPSDHAGVVAGLQFVETFAAARLD
jgi:endonuclease/exonuclease/phosphatase family metal-dependent hydrolase